MRKTLDRPGCTPVERSKRKMAGLMVLLLLVGTGAVFAAEEGINGGLDDLFRFMAVNRSTTARDQLSLELLEFDESEADREASRIYNVGVYEQGFDNTLKRDVAPLEATSRITVERHRQEAEPVRREAELYRAVQTWRLTGEQWKREEALLALTREDSRFSALRHEAGIISDSDLANAVAAVKSAELGLERVRLQLNSAAMEINRLIGAELDAPVTLEGEIALLESSFSNGELVETWLASALEADNGRLSIVENIVLLDLKLEISTDFLTDTHSRVVRLKRDREDARLQMRDTESRIEADLRNRLNDRLTAVDQLELARLDLQMAERRKQQMVARQNVGMASRVDLIPRDRELLHAEYAVTAAIASLNNQEVALRSLTGIRMGPVQEVDSE